MEADASVKILADWLGGSGSLRFPHDCSQGRNPGYTGLTPLMTVSLCSQLYPVRGLPS